MGILEVHDGKGRVERVKLTKENPVLFGTNPMCDIVLSGAGVAPFHGRIRWADRRFKVDAGAEVGSLDINGKTLKSSTLYQGDEIAVGPCRIFVISVEEPGAAAPRPAAPGPKDVDDRTRIIDTPAAIAKGIAGVPPATPQPKPKPKPAPPASPPPAKSAPRQSGGFAEPSFEFEPGDVEEAPEAPAAKRPDFAPNAPLKRGRAAKREEFLQAKAAAAPPAAAGPIPGGAPPSFLDKIKRMLPATDGPPGTEKIWTNPLVLGLAGGLIVLVFLSVSLVRGINRANAEKAYNRAVESLNEGDYANAVVRFDEFIKGHASDPRTSKAQVLQAMAKVRQFTGAAGASWTQALESAQKMFDEQGKKPEFEDVANELGDQLVKAVEAFADKAKAAADPAPLAEADAAIALHVKILGPENSAKFLERSKGPSKIIEAKAAILKTKTRLEALAAMTAALDAKKPGQVYEARDGLVKSYPDLINDKEVLARLVKANDLIKADASSDSTNRSGATAPHPDPLGPPVSFVLRSNPGTAASGGPTVYALADGHAFAVDGATGAPIWMVPVGLASPFVPMPIAGGEPSVIAFDSRFDEMVKLDAKTGKLIWRQELKERIVDPPLIVGNQLYQTTPSGKLLVLDLRSGNLLGSLNLGRKLARSPVMDESGEHLYVLGDEDCLYVLNRNPIACLSVEYIGHDSGSIPCPPARVGRFLIVVENSGMNTGKWKVVLLDEKGLNPRIVQTINIAGWTWSTPRDVGSIIWSVSDRNEVAVYTIGLYDNPEPLKLLARLNPDNETSGPAYAQPKTDREFWVSSGRTSGYSLVSDSGKLDTSWTLGDTGPAVAPIQEAGKIAVLTHQAFKMPGIALRGIDPARGKVLWHTILGAPFPVDLEPGVGGQGLRTLGLSGEVLTISAEMARGGGFVEGKIPPPGDFTLPPSGDIWLPVEGPTVVVPGKNASKFLVRREDGFKPLDLPTPLRALPLLWGKEAFLPGNDGRAYLINPHTGEPAADPFVPPFDKAHPSSWKNPVKIDGDAMALIDEEGHLRRVARNPNPRPHLEITADQKMTSPPAAEIASTGGAVIVVTVEGEIRAFSARDLSPVGKWTLEAPRAAGPVAAGGHVFVGDAAGNVLAFGPDGNKLWQVKLREPMASGAPAVKGDVVHFLTRSGSLESRAVADGSARGRIALGVLPTGGVLDVGEDRYIPAGRGTIRAIRPDIANLSNNAAAPKTGDQGKP